MAWRLTRRWWEEHDPQALEEYEAPWVQAYGQLALEVSLKFTEHWLKEADNRGIKSVQDRPAPTV